MAFAVDNNRMRNGTSMDRVGEAFPIDALGGPGTYVCNASGHLLRVLDAEPRASRSSGSPARGEPRLATKISTNPHLERARARALAGVFGLRTNF